MCVLRGVGVAIFVGERDVLLAGGLCGSCCERWCAECSGDGFSDCACDSIVLIVQVEGFTSVGVCSGATTAEYIILGVCGEYGIGICLGAHADHAVTVIEKVGDCFSIAGAGFFLIGSC